jgi:hypothetical protein
MCRQCGREPSTGGAADQVKGLVVEVHPRVGVNAAENRVKRV